ncbi:ankyrin repeat domain-containing protein [Photobacterium profundum]|uniref:ankyrin repeat domain-containing protein n=1 Tax=Photobacterium profundum TaxID=74109 RepID=UPI00059D2DF0|nr:ankyrin repeat domain-containing protein [Photobacterium profundum]
MKKSVFISVPLLCFVLYLSMALYSLSTSAIDDIIICGTNDDTHYFPKGVCEYYLFNSRLTSEDILTLEANSGLAFLFGIQDKSQRYAYIKYFLSEGVSINAISTVDGLSPLHAAIIRNDSKLVGFLLQNGASLSQKESNYGLTPFDFLIFLSEKNSNVDRNDVFEVMSNASEY